MAALLVAMSVMAVLMGALMPQCTTLATREKEQELIFRGNQYARAIGLFQRKFANTAPPTIDVLVEQRFLRKKYKDPIANDDFQPIYASQAIQSGTPRPGQPAPPPTIQTPPSGVGGQRGLGTGGIIGVTSKSTETSLRVFNGRSKYNEWAFVYVQTVQRPQGSGQGGQPGQVPGQPGRVGPQQPVQPQRPGAFGMPSGSFGSQPNRPPVPGPARQPGN